MLRPVIGSYVEVYDEPFVSLPHIKAIQGNTSKDYVTLWNLKKRVRQKQRDGGATTLGLESKTIPTASEKLIETTHVFYSHDTQKLKFRTVGIIKDIDYDKQLAQVRLLLEKNQFVQSFNIDKELSFSNLRVVSRAEFKILFKQPFISEQLVKKSHQLQEVVRAQAIEPKKDKTKKDQSLEYLEKPVVNLHRRVYLDEPEHVDTFNFSRKQKSVKELKPKHVIASSDTKIDSYLMDMREEVTREISTAIGNRTVCFFFSTQLTQNRTRCIPCWEEH
jgi:hypothetical protein